MRTNKYLFTLLFLAFTVIAFAQNQNLTAKIAGVVLDENNQPVENVSVSYQTKTATTDKNGFYEITVPANQKVILVFTHVSLKKIIADRKSVV